MIPFALFTAIVVSVYVALAYLQKVHGVRVVTCVIRPEQLGDVTYALIQSKLAVGMTVMNVRGFGRQRAEEGESVLAAENLIRFLPKLKLEILVGHSDVDRMVTVIGDTLRTGGIGDGKIIVFSVTRTMRIRTGETGLSAL